MCVCFASVLSFPFESFLHLTEEAVEGLGAEAVLVAHVAHEPHEDEGELE